MQTMKPTNQQTPAAPAAATMGAKLLNVEQVASILQCSKQTVYAYAKNRQLAFYRIMGKLKFKESDVFEYIENYRVSKVDQPI